MDALVLMPIYEWKRLRRSSGFACFGEEATVPAKPVWQYAETTTMDPPEGEGWQRVYSLGIGAVKGAGLSPARQVNGR